MKVTLAGTSYEKSFFKSETNGVFSIADLKNAFTSKINLKHQTIEDASSLIKIVAPFSTTSDGLTIDASNPFYIDKTNKEVYTKIDGEKKVIDQEENKYFKNTLNIYGVYSETASYIDGVSTVSKIMTSISGYDFRVSSLAPSDRIISISQIKLRSLDSTSLENSYVSALTTVTGYLAGFKVDSDGNPCPVIGFDLKDESVLNKMSTIATVKSIWPYENGEDADSNDEHTFIEPPKVEYGLVQDVSGDDSVAFTYKKNALVTKVKIDLTAPTTLDFSNNPEALEKISINDTILSVLPLSSLNKTGATLTLDGGVIPYKVIYSEPYLAVISDKYLYVIDCSNWANLNTTENTYKVLWSDFGENIESLSECDGAYFDGTTIKVYGKFYGVNQGVSEFEVDVTDFIQNTTSASVSFNEDSEDYVDVSDCFDVITGEDNERILLRDLAVKDGLTRNTSTLVKNVTSGTVTPTTMGLSGLWESDTKTFEKITITADGTTNLTVDSDVDEIAIWDNNQATWELTSVADYYQILKDYEASNSEINVFMFNSEQKYTGPDTYGYASYLARVPRPTDGSLTFAMINTHKDKGFTVTASSSLTITYTSEIQTADYSDLSTGIYGEECTKVLKNDKGYVVALSGDNLFVYSPNVTYSEDDDGNAVANTTLSDNYYWKVGHLPLVRNLNFLTFDSMTTDEVYSEVKTMLDYVMENYVEQNMEDDTESGLLAMYNWINNNPLMTFDEFKTSAEANNYIVALTGIKYVMQNGKKIPYFSNDNTDVERYAIPQETSILTTDSITQYAYKQMWLYYVVDYYTVILGANKFKDFSIVDAYLTDSQLNIFTEDNDLISIPTSCLVSREQIEEPTNWKVAKFADDYDYLAYDGGSTDEDEHPIMYKNSSGSKVTDTYDDFLKEDSVKVFSIKDVYVEDNLIMIAGVVDGSLLNDYAASIDLQTDFGSYSIPKVFYSTDNGKTFSEYTLTVDLGNVNGFAGSFIRQSDCVSFTYGVAEAEISNAKMVRVDIEIEESDSSVTLGDGTVVESTVSEITELNIVRNNFSISDNEVTGAFIKSQGTNSYKLDDLSSSNEIYLYVPVSVDYSGAVVVRKTSTSIVVNNSPTAAESEFYALVSINTALDIPDQTLFLTDDDAYYRSDGVLKVPETIDVDSEDTANRVYNSNYDSANHWTTNSYGIPTLAYDVNHDKSVYTYSSAGAYNALTNNSGNIIHLCDANGNYVSHEPSSKTVIGIDEIIPLQVAVRSSSFEIDGLPAAPTLSDDYEPVSLNETLTAMFNSIKGKKVLTISRDSSFPYLELKGGDYTALITELLGGMTFTEYKVDSNFGDFIAEFEENNGALDGSYKTFADKYESRNFGSLTNLVWDKEYEMFIFDCSYKTAIIINTAYETSTSKELETNLSMTFENNVINAVTNGEVTGIYFNPLGYGGDINNEDWNKRLPWDNDSKAFTNALAKNAYGENIYMVDSDGLNLKSNVGMDFVESTKYSKSTMPFYKNKVEMFKDYESSDKDAVYIYKLPTHTLKLYTAEDVYWNAINNGVNKNKLLVKVFCDNVDVTNDAEISVSDCSYADGFVSGIAENSYITITATYHGYSASKKVTVDTMDASSYIPYLSDITPIFYGNDYLLSTQSETFTFSGKLSGCTTVPSSTTFALSSVADANVVLNTTEDYTKEVTLAVSLNDFTRDINLLLVNNEYEIIANKDYYDSSISEIEAKVRIDGSIINCEPTDGAFVYQNGNLVLTKEVSQKTTNVDLSAVTFENFFIDDYAGDSEEYEYSCSDGDIITKGLPSLALVPVMAYSTFSDLVSNESQVIEVKTLATRDTEDIAEISYVGSKTVEFSCDDLDFDEDIDDKIVMFNVCTGATINLSLADSNKSSRLYEVPKADLDVFGYDRVFINSNAFPYPMSIVDNKAYYPDSIDYYKTSLWTNTNGNPVYLCDEDGKYAMWEAIDDYTLNIAAITDTNAMTQTQLNNRVQPYAPFWETNYECYVDCFYVNGKDENPFNRYVKIKDVYKDGKHMAKGTVLKQVKKSGKRIYSEDSDYTLSNPEIDHKNGKVSYILTGSSDCSLFKTSQTLYGIKVTGNGLTVSDVYKNPTTLTVNSSSENKYKINYSKDDLVDITEIGLFDENDNLIAYAAHPKVEYSTDKNHISYNLIIEE